MLYTESDNCFMLGITAVTEVQRKEIVYEVLVSTVKKIRGKCPTMDIVALIENCVKRK